MLSHSWQGASYSYCPHQGSYPAHRQIDIPIKKEGGGKKEEEGNTLRLWRLSEGRRTFCNLR